MAVTYFYPAPEINVGKPFLGEYLTSFLNQRKDDHKLMIARKLKALDPSRLIALEQSHVRNVGRLTEQIARIEREERSTQGRMDVARIKADGAIRAQEIAAKRGGRKDVSDLIGTIIGETQETYRETRESKPSESELQTLVTGVRSDDAAQYVSNLRATLSQNRSDKVKREWLVHEAYRLANNNNHSVAAAAIKNNFGSVAPSIADPDPWESFVERNPGVEAPDKAADRLIKKYARRLDPQVKSIIKTQVLKATAPPAPRPGGAPIGLLATMLADEKAELQQVRGERREMQAAYKKTAFDSYMTPWLAPSYTKAPEWQQDLEIMGDMGAKRPTRFSHFMETATDVYMEPSVAGLGVLRQQDPTEVENRYRALETEPGGPGYGGQPALVGPSESAPFVSPGDQDAVAKLAGMVRYYQAEMKAGDTRGAAKQLFDMYALLKASPDQYGETGASIVRSIDAAHKTGNYGNLYNEVVGAAKQGQASVVQQAEETRRANFVPYVAEELTDKFPYRDVTDVDIQTIEALNLAGLTDWGKSMAAKRAALKGKTDPSSKKAFERIDSLLRWAVVDPADPANVTLLKVKRAEEAVAKAKVNAEKAATRPELDAQDRQSIEQLKSRGAALQRTMASLIPQEGLPAVRPTTPATTAAEQNVANYYRAQDALKKIGSELNALQAKGRLSEDGQNKATAALKVQDAAEQLLKSLRPGLTAPYASPATVPVTPALAPERVGRAAEAQAPGLLPDAVGKLPAEGVPAVGGLDFSLDLYSEDLIDEEEDDDFLGGAMDLPPARGNGRAEK